MESIRNQRDAEVWLELRDASDRVLAIVSAAFIDDRLSDAIKIRLLRDPKQIKKVFSPDGALGTYESKVVLRYLLNIYIEETRQNLLAVGQIRNRFAHFPEVKTFNHKRLEPFFKDITLPDRFNRIRGVVPANSWNATITGLMRPVDTDAPKRLRFEATIQMLLAFLQPQVYREEARASDYPPF